jgi:hypothetical protein
VKFLKSFHFSNLWRDCNQVAAVEGELLNRNELGDGGRERNNLPPHLFRHFRAREELFATLVSRFIDETE